MQILMIWIMNGWFGQLESKYFSPSFLRRKILEIDFICPEKSVIYILIWLTAWFRLRLNVRSMLLCQLATWWDPSLIGLETLFNCLDLDWWILEPTKLDAIRTVHFLSGMSKNICSDGLTPPPVNIILFLFLCVFVYISLFQGWI